MYRYKRKAQTEEERDLKKLKTQNPFQDKIDLEMPVHNDIYGNSVKERFTVTKIQWNVPSDDNEDPLIGDHETQESAGGEANLHKYIFNCKKNPGHSQFIPVDTFTLKHLPEGHQDNDLFELIKATADLTVRVDVQMISQLRPKLWPNTSQPYPFHKINLPRNLRTGSGRVRNVIKFENGNKKNGGKYITYTNCWCRKCEDSDSPSNVWWEFNVQTATHLVFDDIEASHTTLRLFYDKDDSTVVSVNRVSVAFANIGSDFCMLKCVTCDTNLGYKLTEMWEHYTIVYKEVNETYKISRDKHKLNFIVSHPHGCSKRVSVGQWKEKLLEGLETKFTYTTCTCPGSSGASVQCLGFSEVWVSDLVHSGTKSGINYSAAGYVQ